MLQDRFNYEGAQLNPQSGIFYALLSEVHERLQPEKAWRWPIISLKTCKINAIIFPLGLLCAYNSTILLEDRAAKGQAPGSRQAHTDSRHVSGNLNHNDFFK